LIGGVNKKGSPQKGGFLSDCRQSSFL